ncbi:hypothetical protein BKA70DRAFT_1317495, partial [Coprinopsis sp. MPI-PUGE-AT-0042]
ELNVRPSRAHSRHQPIPSSNGASSSRSRPSLDDRQAYAHDRFCPGCDDLGAHEGHRPRFQQGSEVPMPALISPVEISNPPTLLSATTLVTNIDSACRLSRCPSLVRRLPQEAECRAAIIAYTLVKLVIYPTTARVFASHGYSHLDRVKFIVLDPQPRAVSLGIDVVQGRLPPRAIWLPLVQLSQDIYPRTTGARPFRASSLGFHLPRKTSMILNTS